MSQAIELDDDGGEITFTVVTAAERKEITLDLYEASAVLADVGGKFQQKPLEDYWKAVRNVLQTKYHFPAHSLKVTRGFIIAVHKAKEELEKNAGGGPRQGSPGSTGQPPSPSPGPTS